MDGWADGLNFYLHTHPEVKPRVITQFEPWMALSFSEGSIGGDIERVSLAQLEAFYGGRSASADAPRSRIPPRGRAEEPPGSNGFAIAPANSARGRRCSGSIRTPPSSSARRRRSRARKG